MISEIGDKFGDDFSSFTVARDSELSKSGPLKNSFFKSLMAKECLCIWIASFENARHINRID